LVRQRAYTLVSEEQKVVDIFKSRLLRDVEGRLKMRMSVMNIFSTFATQIIPIEQIQDMGI